MRQRIIRSVILPKLLFLCVCMAESVSFKEMAYWLSRVVIVVSSDDDDSGGRESEKQTHPPSSHTNKNERRRKADEMGGRIRMWK